MATDTSGILSSNVVALDSDYLKLSKEVKSQNELGKDTFINLLCTQMQYQDPLNPMDNSEMLAQLAQFTALEQMMNVAQVNQKQLANSMIGQYVEYYYEDSASGSKGYAYGKVDYVDISGDTPKLGIGDKTIELDKVYGVIDKENIQANTTAYDLIGKTVQATVTQEDENGKSSTYTVEGKVESVSIKDGTASIVIGTGKDKITTEFSNVKNIVEKTSITGKTITATVKDAKGNTTTVTGEAQYIKIDSNNKYFVYVNDQLVDYDDITSVA